MSCNPGSTEVDSAVDGNAARKRGATEVGSTTTSTLRPGQAVEAAAFGDFDGVAQGTVQKTDRFGRVVSRYARTVPTEAQRCLSYPRISG